MKYIFIVNPAAGQKGSENNLLNQLKQHTQFDYLIHTTTAPKEAIEFIKGYCLQNPVEDKCFVACGGDGTINEVVNGIYGHSNTSFAILPTGSGNDFIKSINSTNQLNIDNLLNGKKRKIDVITIGDKVAINVVNFGFECWVAYYAQKVKRIPLLGGNNSYTTGIVMSLIKGLTNHGDIIVNGQIINDNNRYMIASLSNGGYCGGGYNCAPLCKLDDGLGDLLVVKPISIFKMIKVIGKYKKGTHLQDDSLKDILKFQQCEEVEIKNDKQFPLCIDGEVVFDTYFKLKVENSAVELLEM